MNNTHSSTSSTILQARSFFVALIAALTFFAAAAPAVGAQAHPTCEYGFASDTDFEGWGWENGATCIVDDEIPTRPTAGPDWHVDRNELNVNLPATLEAARRDSNWTEQPEELSIFHDDPQTPDYERKFTHPDGREAVYYPHNGALVTDPRYELSLIHI